MNKFETFFLFFFKFFKKRNFEKLCILQQTNPPKSFFSKCHIKPSKPLITKIFLKDKKP